MSRVRSIRTGQWIELPDGDGMFHYKNHPPVSFDSLHQRFRRRLEQFDALSPTERNIINYYPGPIGSPGTWNSKIKAVKTGKKRIDLSDLGL